MEKISGIVRGSPRVSSVDMQQVAPARAGAPGFGRPVAESTGFVERQSTAQKAVALHKEMQESKKALIGDRTVQNLADQFFMSRVRRPEEQPAMGTPGQIGGPIQGAAPGAPSVPVDAASAEEAVGPTPEELAQAKYTPRGSFIDVRA